MTGLAFELIEVITDLIRINIDRAECFENTMRESEVLDMELIQILIDDAQKSRNNAKELIDLITVRGISFTKDIARPGKIYLLWKDAKKLLSANDRLILLYDYACGKEAALEAYRAALTSESLNDYASRNLIMDQKYSLQISQEMIKKYRDLQDLVSLIRINPAIDIKSKFINTKVG